jgi:Zn-dependent peptidase ImmA (M78 family)/plasmid maintenance system antidote protein VapI
MNSSDFQPNWASPPGHTISAVLNAKGIPLLDLRNTLALQEHDLKQLLNGSLPITSTLAKRLSIALGSTPRFWIERQKQYQNSIRVIDQKRPDLVSWYGSFPLKFMHERGWLAKAKDSANGPSELLDFFGVADIDEWKEKYLARLSKTKFRTSQAFENSVAATTAWIRHGEQVAESIACAEWDRSGFHDSLHGLKRLTLVSDPADFIPQLRTACAKFGVVVVVARSIPGCAASGATCTLENDRALLLLSGRFLSDDQFWFSFFHEAAHLILHKGSYVEEDENTLPELEAEANSFAQSLILSPQTEASLETLPKNKFAIARFAKRCGVSPGVIVGQLQNRGRIPQGAYNALKVRYEHSSLNL